MQLDLWTEPSTSYVQGVKPARITDARGSGKMVDDYWGPSKRVLGDSKFLESLIEYDKDNMQSEIIMQISDSILHDENFDPNKFESTAAKGIYYCHCHHYH